ncbi:MAG: hypothetical protein L6R38_000794 [Xanthoria sp. 2 TBL-2021]|nr:MAG: hypothetical protein L6R38_000794 [Xanthoria sp. 2 TBL-2021]
MKKILKYEHIRINRASAQSWRDEGHQVTDYDGIVVLEAESEEDIRELFRDEEYLGKLAPSEAEFSERRSFVMMPARVVSVMDRTK